MKFSTKEYEKQKVYVSQHVKIPYASNLLDIIKTAYKPYNKIYNTLYQAANGKDVTYFFSRNNYIYYYRETANKTALFQLDILRGDYRIFDTSHLAHEIKDPDSIVVKTEDGKWYIITDDVDWAGLQDCVAVINLTNGDNLYIESRSNNLYLQAFPPIFNSIVPIIQVTKSNINIHMVDLNVETIETISWDLSDLKNLISMIVSQSRRHVKTTQEVILGDKIIQIDKFSEESDYIYRTGEKGNSYLKVIKINFQLSLSGERATYDFVGLQIRIEVERGYIICKWNVDFETGSTPPYLTARIKDTNVPVTYRKVPYGLDDYEINRKIIKLTVRRYPHVLKERDNYVSNILYSDDCINLLSNGLGLGISTNKSRMVHYHDESVVLYYKGYIIIVANFFTQQDRKIKKLLIMDVRQRLMGIWEINKTEWACKSETVMYNYYYLKDYDMLILISNDHESICLFFIKIGKITDIFKSRNKMDCEIQKYKHIEDVVRSYDIKELLIEAIIRHHRKNPREESVRIIGYLVDEDKSKIYVIAKYMLSEGKNIPEASIKIYTSLFIGEISNGELTFKVDYYIVGSLKLNSRLPSSSNLNKIKGRQYRIADLIKLDLYNHNYSYRHNFRYNKAENLDLSYDENILFSLRYNRRSCKIIRAKQYIIWADLFKVANVFLLRYKYSGKKGIDHNEFLFVIHDLTLVGKMPVLSFSE